MMGGSVIAHGSFEVDSSFYRRLSIDGAGACTGFGLTIVVAAPPAFFPLVADALDLDPAPAPAVPVPAWFVFELDVPLPLDRMVPPNNWAFSSMLGETGRVI